MEAKLKRIRFTMVLPQALDAVLGSLLCGGAALLAAWFLTRSVLWMLLLGLPVAGLCGWFILRGRMRAVGRRQPDWQTAAITCWWCQKIAAMGEQEAAWWLRRYCESRDITLTHQENQLYLLDRGVSVPFIQLRFPVGKPADTGDLWSRLPAGGCALCLAGFTLAARDYAGVQGITLWEGGAFAAWAASRFCPPREETDPWLYHTRNNIPHALSPVRKAMEQGRFPLRMALAGTGMLLLARWTFYPAWYGIAACPCFAAGLYSLWRKLTTQGR